MEQCRRIISHLEESHQLKGIYINNKSSYLVIADDDIQTLKQLIMENKKISIKQQSD